MNLGSSGDGRDGEKDPREMKGTEGGGGGRRGGWVQRSVHVTEIKHFGSERN